jgi:hypothetical protein
MEADLRGADLRDADLGVSEEMKEPTDLSKVNLSGSNLQGADANVTKEQLAICKFLEGATMPDGSRHAQDAPDGAAPDSGALSPPPRGSHSCAMSRMLMTPSRLSCMVKGNAVVAIGVDRRRVGRDNGARRRLPARQVRLASRS